MAIYELVANLFILGLSLALIAVGALVIYLIIKLLMDDW